MALKTVTGKLTGPDNAPVGGALVQAQLSAQAVISSTQEIAASVVSTYTQNDGTWSLSLESNLDLTPNTTYYTIRAGSWIATAVVPAGNGPYKVEDIMAAPPAVSPPAALDASVVHLALTETISDVKHFGAAPVFDAGAMPSSLQFRQGNKTVALGDSTSLGASDLPNARLGDSYFSYAVIISSQRIQYAFNAGVAGDKTSQMLARVTTDVIAKAPSRCFVLGGTNDVANSVPFATTVANLTAIVNTLIANAIEPVLCTITPRSDNTAFHVGIVKLNAWIKGYCASHGLNCIDFYNVLVDPATGNYKAGLGNVDGIHPSITAGQIAMANEVARLYPETLNAFRPYLTSATDSLDTINLILNGTMQSGGTRATSWVLNSGLANTVESIITGDTSIVGNWQQAAFSGATTYELIQTIAVGSQFAVGDKMAFAGLISTSGFTPNVGTYTARVVASGANINVAQPVGALTGAIPSGMFYYEFVVPAATTALVVHLTGQPDAAGGTMKFAQMTLVNLTQLGL